MKKITLVIATLLTVAACKNMKPAETTPETVSAFKASSAGQWVSKCTQILDVIDQKGNSSQISIFLNEDNTALIRVATYSGDLNCKATTGTSGSNLTTDEYKFEYLVSESVFPDAAKLVLTSVETSGSTLHTVLHLKVKTYAEGKDAKGADVKLLTGSTIVVGGTLKKIPDSLLPKAQLRFKKAAF